MFHLNILMKCPPLLLMGTQYRYLATIDQKKTAVVVKHVSTRAGGYGRRLIVERSWVRILARYTGWT